MRRPFGSHSLPPTVPLTLPRLRTYFPLTLGSGPTHMKQRVTVPLTLGTKPTHMKQRARCALAAVSNSVWVAPGSTRVTLTPLGSSSCCSKARVAVESQRGEAGERWEGQGWG